MKSYFKLFETRLLDKKTIINYSIIIVFSWNCTFVYSQNANKCLFYKIHILPIVLVNESDIDSSFIKSVFRSKVDSLVISYFEEKSGIISTTLCNCCMILSSNISYGDNFNIPNMFKYKLSVSLIDSRQENEIYKVEIHFKNLSEYIKSGNIFGSRLSRPYVLIFSMFGDKILPKSKILIKQDSNIQKTELQKMISAYFQEIIDKKQRNSPFTKGAMQAKIDTIEIEPLISETSDRVTLQLKITSTNYINLIDVNGQEINTNYNLLKRQNETFDYSYFYGKMNTFIYRLIEANL